MKGGTLILLAVFLFKVFLQSGDSVGGLTGLYQPRCCNGYQRRPLPWWLMESWSPTSQSCHKSAVIFLTKKGRQVCMDPSKDWVQKLMQRVSVTT
ncbi:CC chemokine vCCL2 [Colobine gammaherpesvirus 1]|uniref:CC chemokine vCCL2 n=1 Tax=Colobine gammaherpesvirus 1 TaxID=2597325 RepID=A0A5B8G3X0_9GAMA|nr:CC chemokine vCCL2 [Colobine gammaherpesvirus 1]QDQ69221.1 CC chemokine vCCL2 [Colobine gammaherpesvirus 1]